MNNTIQLYVDEEKQVKGFPLTSPDRVIDSNGKSIKDKLKNNVKFDVVGPGTNIPPIDGRYDEQINDIIKQMNVINNKQGVFVTDFGADSTGLNDSYAEIQKAIDYAYTNNKKIVIFPEGRYKITKGFKFRNGIKYYSPNGAIIFIDDDYIGTTEGILNNYNGTNNYNKETADSFEIENLTFLYDSTLKFNSKTLLLLRNVNGVNIINCKFKQEKKLDEFTTEISNLDLYACCKNVNIVDCEFTVLSDTSAGGNIWIRNFSKDNDGLTNLTENIKIDNCRFLKKAHDEMIAVFNSGVGSIKNVIIKNSNFKLLDSTSTTPICLAFRASGSTVTENITFENNYVDVDNFSFHVLETNRGTGLLKNCNIINNTFYIRTTTSSNTFFNYGTGPIENVNISNNTIYFIKENDNQYSVEIGIRNVNNVKDNYIKGHVKTAIAYCDNAFNNTIKLSNDFNGTGILLCKNIINNVINDVYTGVKINADGRIFVQNNRITLSNKELAVSFMLQGTDVKIFALIRDNFVDKVEGDVSNIRYLWVDTSPNIKISFENNIIAGSYFVYSTVVKLHYSKNNLIGNHSDTYSGIPNYRIRDVLPIGHEVFDPVKSKKYIKITNTNSDKDWKEININ